MDEPHQPSEPPDPEPTSFFDELQRRVVVRTAIVYAASGWAMLQVSALVLPLIGLNSSAIRWVLYMLIAGFVLAIALARLSELRAERGEPPLRVFSNHAVVIVLLMLGIGALAGAGVDPWFDEDEQAAQPIVIAVEPFDTRGQTESAPTLGADLADELTDALARFRGLTVRRAPEMPEDGGFLGLESLAMRDRFRLTGSAQVDGETVRVRAQLVEPDSGVVRWSESYDRELTTGPLLHIQTDIASHIAATLADHTVNHSLLSPAKRFTIRPHHRSMAECIAMADRYFEVHTDEQHAAARECLEAAVQREPDDAEAWAHLGYLYREEYLHRRNERSAPLDRALRAAHRAVSLDPTSAMAHFALSTVYFSRGALDAAAMTAEHAIKLNQNDATLLGLLSTQLAAAGRWERAIEVAERAASLSPHHPVTLHNVVALDHYMRGDYEAALDAHRQIAPLDSMRGVTRAAVLAQAGRTDQAAEVMSELERDDPHLAQDLMAELERIYVDRGLVEALADGLRSAGIELEPRARAGTRKHSYSTRSRGYRARRQTALSASPPERSGAPPRGATDAPEPEAEHRRGPISSP